MYVHGIETYLGQQHVKEIAEAINETRKGEGVEIMVQRKRCLAGGLYIGVIALSDMRRDTILAKCYEG